MIFISEFGIKIKNFHAGMIYEYNLGVREYYTYTDAMLNNSLFSFYLQKHGMNVYKGESTRDFICIDFDYGSKGYEDEVKRLTKLINKAKKEEKDTTAYEEILKRIHSNKDKYVKKSRDEIRKEYYKDGVTIKYETKDKKGNIKSTESIHYVMLFRTPAKAKLGQCFFINEKLYDVAYDWMTIGLGKKMPVDNAKIVEMSAYAPLTTSTIVDTMVIPVQDVLILSDQDSFFETMANVVSAEDTKFYDIQGNPIKKCIVTQEKRKVKNTLWDGMGLIESDILPEFVNGMALLRNHMFKMCGIRTYIQKFFKDWCAENGKDYEKYKVKDVFGVWHKVKDVKVITTNNAVKWLLIRSVN